MKLNLNQPPLTTRQEIYRASATLARWESKASLWSHAYGYGANDGTTYKAFRLRRKWAASDTWYNNRNLHPMQIAWREASHQLRLDIQQASERLSPRQYFRRELRDRAPVFVQGVGAPFDAETVILQAWHKMSADRNSASMERVKDWLENRTGNEYIECEDGKLVLSDDAHYCELSGCYYSTDDEFVTYYTSGHRFVENSGHEDAVKRKCFLCERSDEWFDRHDFSRTDVDGETVCHEWYEDEMFYWDSDGEYHWDPEPEDDDDDDDARGRSSYHSNPRPKAWLQASKAYGVENEVNCEDMEDFCSALDGSGLFTEEDASLDSKKGVEVVGGPFTLEQYQTRSTSWEAFYERVPLDNVTGHGAGIGYGMHVNMSRDHFTSTFHLSKFTVLLNQMEKLCKCIAQRSNVYQGSYKTRCKVTKQVTTAKFEPVNVSDNRVEVRIFRANAKPERMIKNVEFCDAAKEYVKLASVQDISDETKATEVFLSWLDIPAHRTSYPALVAFLGEQWSGKEQWKKKAAPNTTPTNNSDAE